MRTAFLEAVGTLRSSGCATSDLEAPFEAASFDVTHIGRDRETVSSSLFKDVDVLVLPTLADVPPSLAEARDDQAVAAANTFFANYYGLPAVSVPCGFSRNGLPLGFQIVGPSWGEGDVLRLAHLFKQATRWHVQRPDVD